MKKQVVVIHGADTFATREEYMNFLRNFEINIERYKTSKDDWMPWLREKLGEEYEVILPVMPNKFNAQFEEWKLWFEKFLPYLNDEVILVGHSFGASFIAKYLSENVFTKKLKGVFLVSGVFDKDSDGYPLLSFSLPSKLDLQTENVFLYHSKDDDVVPFSAVEHFKEALPQAEVRVFENRKHINQEEFPELLEDIMNLG
jgi:predicted alpha/beta hydrolase family esterase